MERLDVQVRTVRDQTGNQQYTSTQGIRQREFVRHANDAQMRIYNLLLQERSSLFMKVDYIDTTANNAVYSLPADIFLKHNVLKVDYSANGNALNYAPLQMRTPHQEVSAPGYPDSYFLRQGQIVVSPYPTQAAVRGLRLNYQYTVPTIDIRRASIASIAFVAGTTYDITLTAPSGQLLNAETIDDLSNGWADYFSICSASGVIAASALTFVSYTAATYVLRVTSAASLLGLTGYLTYGTYSSTHSQLPDVCERYILDYMAARIQMRDSNTEASDTAQMLRALEQEILDAIANLEEDTPAIPILDNTMLNYDENL